MSNCRNIRYPAPTQDKTEWCWAAVTNYVDTILRGEEYYSQCEIAKKRTPKLCTGECEEYDCNRWNFLDESLDDIGRLDGPPTHRPLTPTEVLIEIEKDKPVGVRIQWRKPSKPEEINGHFVAIIGYFYAGSKLFYRVYNPSKPGSIKSVEVEEFKTNYRKLGYWTHSFRTK